MLLAAAATAMVTVRSDMWAYLAASLMWSVVGLIVGLIIGYVVGYMTANRRHR